MGVSSRFALGCTLTPIQLRLAGKPPSLRILPPSMGKEEAHTACSAIFCDQILGASWWTLLPSASTATVTGMSCTVNS